ncbi:arrestin domain-containing protein 3 [Drosophila ficusphila]|uniref:arrestin domain-containing protein 3 n=1 Tax=Drosophila ficusphila TaxID=30025 RepID=UPI0007E7A991|nr:arrestin domain-containing protein 3 [Drosophila ficusphila]
MPSQCTFELDRPEPIYYSGETINGRAILTTTSEKSVNEVYILFEGEAKVRWEESKSRRGNGRTHHYTEYYRGNQTYLNTRTNVFGSGNLPPGTHIYTFCIPLPLDCPSSVVAKYGKISYEVSVVIDRQWRFNNVFKQPLTVLQTYNLNMSPQLLMPLMREDIKHFCCWPCSSGPVLSTLTIPFGGYAPGQRIRFTLEIDNQSGGYDLDGIEVKLKQTYVFQASTPHHKTREKDHILNESCQQERVLRLSKRIIDGTLAIPAVPPSSRNNGIISVNYKVILSIKTGDCHVDTDFEVPIVIGTIPLIQSAEDPSNAAQWIPQTPDTPAGAAADLPPSYDNCKPPSFEHATNADDKFVDIDVDEHNRTDDFIPRYPMYTNFAMPSAPPLSSEDPDTPLLQSPPVLSLPHNATAPFDGDGNPNDRPPASYGWSSNQ